MNDELVLSLLDDSEAVEEALEFDLDIICDIYSSANKDYS